MNIREQKLFFTRDGFSIWEEICELSSEITYEIINWCLSEKLITTLPASKDEYDWFLYKTYLDLNEEGKEQELVAKISQYFKSIPVPKSDFNGLLYYFPINKIEINKIYNLLKDLDFEGIDHVNVNLFSLLLTKEDIINIRLTTEKITTYMNHKISQKTHTELRIYPQRDIILQTNFSGYTHTDGEKNEFIAEIYKRIAASHQGSSIKPYNFSDHTLRRLLVINNESMPSRYKFDNGIIKFSVDVKHPMSFLDALCHDDIKYLYDNYPISVVKLNRGEEVSLILDGSEGKIMSRLKNLQVIDIDKFISEISVLLRYDYLNHTYEEEMKNLARRRLSVGTIPQREAVIATAKKEIGEVFETAFKDETQVIVKLLQNTFFYCLLEGKIIPFVENTYKLDEKILVYLSKISGLAKEEITQILNFLIKLGTDNGKNIESLLEKLDTAIPITQVINYASGL
ncbi:hypothetical protein Bmyc01_54320 [Bacillus mycoides]|nr:hypothetical protein Bmyc01_54320 [Bacillus mycoides]